MMRSIVESFSNRVDRARLIAEVIHHGQTDLAGGPFAEYQRGVVNKVSSDEAKMVAWLHDTVEDAKPKDFYWLVERLFNFPSEVREAVYILTRHKPKETYAEYIQRVLESSSDLAIEVKVADLLHNLNENCPESLKERYVKALDVLAPFPRSFKGVFGTYYFEEYGG